MDISELIKIQKEQKKNIVTDLSHSEILTNLLLSLYTEVGEFANEVETFKHWKNHKNNNKEKTLLEFIDILKIWGAIAEHMGYSSNDIEQALKQKTEEVKDRLRNDY